MVKLILKIISLQSSERTKVGALYVQGWRWSTGYNRTKAYGDHAEDVAAENYIRKYGEEPSGGTMYCTLSPCTNCAKNIKNRNMNSRYIHKYRGKL